MAGAVPKKLSGGMTAEIIAAVLVPAGLLATCLAAPLEETMGHTQRIVYVHVAMAWLALSLFVVMAVAGAMYLWRRNLWWDDGLQAASEVGWLAASLTLATGSLWAHSAWNTWWTWDPRLLTAFVLWAMYCGLLIVRAGVDDRQRRARLGAVLALLGLADVPLVIMSTRWFRGIHPVGPSMEPGMRLVLLASVIGFSAVFVMLLRRRWLQRGQQRRLEELNAATGS